MCPNSVLIHCLTRPNYLGCTIYYRRKKQCYVLSVYLGFSFPYGAGGWWWCILPSQLQTLSSLCLSLAWSEKTKVLHMWWVGLEVLLCLPSVGYFTWYFLVLQACKLVHMSLYIAIIFRFQHLLTTYCTLLFGLYRIMINLCSLYHSRNCSWKYLCKLDCCPIV